MCQSRLSHGTPAISADESHTTLRPAFVPSVIFFTKYSKRTPSHSPPDTWPAVLQPLRPLGTVIDLKRSVTEKERAEVGRMPSSLRDLHAFGLAGGLLPSASGRGHRENGAGCRSSSRTEQRSIRRPVWFQTPSVRIIGTNSRTLISTDRSFLRPTGPPQGPGLRFSPLQRPLEPARPRLCRRFVGDPGRAPRNVLTVGFPRASGKEVPTTTFRGSSMLAAASLSPRCRGPRAHDRRSDLKSRVRKGGMLRSSNGYTSCSFCRRPRSASPRPTAVSAPRKGVH